jgi:DNA topoisomerase-1
LDRLVGYSLSPLVSDKLSRRGLSAGRVQSVALRLVCEREREIAAFVPVEYWTIEAELEKPSEGKSFVARLFKLNGKDPELHQESDARSIVDVLEKAAWNVFKVERKDRSRKPTAPFTTSTMQQEASRKLGFNARRTMGTAQSLYEGIDIGEGTVGLITYMRTDSVNIAESAQQEARQFISERYGEDFLPATPNKYTSRAKNAQEAHEAVRPTSAYRTPESIKQYLDKDQLRLYELIWQRFVASQMSNAIFDATTVDIEALPAGQSTSALTTADYTPMYWFRASGSIVKFIGFLKVYEESRDEGDAKNEDEDKDGKRLPELSMGDLLNLIRLIPEQHFTQPPPRFTEASLVKALEEYGIGRPSTYATIMTTIQSRNYVTREGKALRPTPLGFQVNDLLVGNFEHYVNVGFTAHIEDELDDIENGARTWQPVLHEFYDPFRDTVKVATSAIPKLERVIEYTGETCPKCGDGKLLYRESRNGKFIGCSNYPKCTHTAPLTMDGVTCPNCGGKLTERRARKGNRAFYGCVNYPTCEFTTWSKPLPIACPTGDGGLMVEAGKGKAKCLKCETVVELAD